MIEEVQQSESSELVREHLFRFLSLLLKRKKHYREERALAMMRILLLVILLSLVKNGESTNSLATLFDGPSPDTSYADGDKVRIVLLCT